MKKLKISILFIIYLFVLTGCNKAKSEDPVLKILGVSTENVDKIEIIHGNIILYPDLEQNDNLTLIEDLNTALENRSENKGAFQDVVHYGITRERWRTFNL